MPDPLKGDAIGWNGGHGHAEGTPAACDYDQTCLRSEDTLSDAGGLRAVVEFANFDGSAAHPNDAAYLVKGVLHRDSIGSLVGPSGVGKSTIALDLGFSVALGADGYYGRRVKRAPVLYVGYEGIAGLRNRIAAMARQHGKPDHWFAHMRQPPLLCKGKDGDQGRDLIIETARDLGGLCGESVGLIIIDTKARATAGDDEDRAADVGFYIHNRIAAIRDATSAAVMTVHHTGKDAGRGARGSSALFAADDFHLLIKKDRTVIIDKARDGRDGPWFSYDLEEVRLRTDADGDPVTACVIKPVSGIRKTKDEKPLPVQARIALDVLNELVISGKTQRRQPLDIGLDNSFEDIDVVLVSDWRAACAAKGLSSDPRKQDNEKRAFSRARSTLYKRNKIGITAECVWLVERARRKGCHGT